MQPRLRLEPDGQEGCNGREDAPMERGRGRKRAEERADPLGRKANITSILYCAYQSLTLIHV